MICPPAGVAAGLAWSLLAGYARRMVAPHQQGKALALAMVGTPIALSLGVPLGTWLGGLVGWRTTFGLMSAVSLVLIAWVLVKVPDYAPQPAHQRLSLRKVLTSASYVTDKAGEHFFDKETQALMTRLRGRLPGYEVNLQSVTNDEQRFIVAAYNDRTPGARYVYDRKTDALVNGLWIRGAAGTRFDVLEFEVEGNTDRRHRAAEASHQIVVTATRTHRDPTGCAVSGNRRSAPDRRDCRSAGRRSRLRGPC